MENVESGQIKFTESTNKKSSEQTIKSRVWRIKTWSHRAAQGDLALNVLLNSLQEKLEKQVQEAMCSKSWCFLAVFLCAHLLLNVYRAQTSISTMLWKESLI